MFGLCETNGGEYSRTSILPSLQDVFITLDGTSKGHDRSFLGIRVGGIRNGKPWSATVDVLEMIEGKTAAEQAKKVVQVWDDLRARQQRQGVQDTDLHTICSITFDNAADNRGVKRGLRVALEGTGKEEGSGLQATCGEGLW